MSEADERLYRTIKGGRPESRAAAMTSSESQPRTRAKWTAEMRAWLFLNLEPDEAQGLDVLLGKVIQEAEAAQDSRPLDVERLRDIALQLADSLLVSDRYTDSVRGGAAACYWLGQLRTELARLAAEEHSDAR